MDELEMEDSAMAQELLDLLRQMIAELKQIHQTLKNQ